MTEQEALIGTWYKLSDHSCAEVYPGELTFQTDLNYLVPMEIVQSDPAPIWQSGAYEVLESSQIRMQASNDAMLSYEIRLTEEDILIFTDESGCEVQYERAVDETG